MASFNEQTPQQQAAAAAALLRQRGVPATAENMNRAYMALMQGQSDMTGANAPVLERAIERSMQPRRAAAPTPPVRGGSSEDDRPDGEPPRQPQRREEGAAAPTRGQRVAEAAALPPERRAAAMPGGRRAGTVNGATRIDEDNPEAGMFQGQPRRQADETGIDQVGLALALGLPLLMGLGGAGLAGRGAGAARGAAPQTGGAVGRVADPAAEYVGRMPLGPNGRIMDVPGPAIAGPAGRAALPPPPAGGAGLRGPASPPQVGGPGGGAAARVEGPTVNQPRLPQADGDLRRRMIDRNMERSNRNAARTRDERAAGNNTRGRRERIDPVPPGEATPRAPQEAIPLPRPRYRVPARSE